MQLLIHEQPLTQPGPGLNFIAFRRNVHDKFCEQIMLALHCQKFESMTIIAYSSKLTDSISISKDRNLIK